jgi:hypothetical protein
MMDEALRNAIAPLMNGETPPPHPVTPRHINVNGREEHEAILRNPQKCTELGLDIYYETMIYLKRWGGWLCENN